MAGDVLVGGERDRGGHDPSRDWVVTQPFITLFFPSSSCHLGRALSNLAMPAIHPSQPRLPTNHRFLKGRSRSSLQVPRRP